MTIAAGFVCSQGVVLCADTQETIQGYVKTDTKKVKLYELGSYKVGFTGAGDSDLIETMLGEMWSAIATIPDCQDQTTVISALRNSAREVFDDCVVPYSGFPRDDRPGATLLVAVQFPQIAQLFKCNGTSFYELNGSECIGLGLALGKSLTEQFFDYELGLAQAGIVASYILYQAKKWVDGCGGNSDVLMLSHRDLSISRIPTKEAKELEKHFDEFSGYLKPLLISAADRTMPHEKFDAVMKQFERDMFMLRAKFMDMPEFWKRLGKMYGLDFPDWDRLDFEVKLKDKETGTSSS